MMPALNFQERFADAIRDGSKCQTFRREGGRRFYPGCPLYLYTGLRTKRAEKLAEVRCARVTRGVIYPDARLVVLSVPVNEDGYVGIEQDADAVAALARRDGFETPAEFFAFFGGCYGDRVEGLFIEWEPLGEVCHD
jgi:hypothetical protein